MEFMPLSFSQEPFWFLNEVEGMSAAYTRTEAIRLSGVLDVNAMAAALGDVVVRHEVLRTVFPVVAGRPCQRVLPPAQDRPVLTVAEPGVQNVRAAIAEVAGRGFDLTLDPPFRAWLLAAGSEEHIIVATLHHIAFDARSMELFWRDLALAYAARLEGSAPGWSPLPAQYADYAMWQRTVLGDEDDPDSLMSRHLAYWRDQLAGLPELLTMPADRQQLAAGSLRVGTATFQIDAGLYSALRALARECGVTIFMVMQAVVAALLTRLGAGTDIPLGSPVTGRADDALAELIGCFVNTLVLRCGTSGNPTFRELISRIRETDLAAYDHQELPFERLVHALNPVRSLNRNPLFQIMIAFYEDRGRDLPLAGISASRESVVLDTAATLDLVFNFIEGRSGEVVDCAVEYASDMFDQKTAESMIRSLDLLLEAVVSDPDAPIGKADIRFPANVSLPFSSRNRAGDPVPAASRDEVPPVHERNVRTAIEETLCQLFSEILQRASVEIHDDFFALGGDSISVIRLISRIRSVLGVKLGMRDFFDNPTVAGAARLVNVSGRQDKLPPIARRAAPS
jgi:acyl carrier protein